MRLLLADIGAQVMALDIRWWGSCGKASMGNTFQDSDWEFTFLSYSKILLLVVEGLCDSCKTHQAVFCTSDGQGGDWIIEQSTTISLNRMVVAQKDTTHQDLSQKVVGI